MATALQITDLRRLISDETEPYTFDDPSLSAFIDSAAGNLNSAAGVVWGVKAARLAGLVDVTEGSSSRKLSQMSDHALKMAAFYGGETATSAGGRSGTRPIVRPS